MLGEVVCAEARNERITAGCVCQGGNVVGSTFFLEGGTGSTSDQHINVVGGGAAEEGARVSASYGAVRCAALLCHTAFLRLRIAPHVTRCLCCSYRGASCRPRSRPARLARLTPLLVAGRRWPGRSRCVRRGVTMQQLLLFPMPFDTAQPIHYFPLFWLQALAGTHRGGGLVVRRGSRFPGLFRRRGRCLCRTFATSRGLLVTLYAPANPYGAA